MEVITKIVKIGENAFVNFDKKINKNDIGKILKALLRKNLIKIDEKVKFVNEITLLPQKCKKCNNGIKMKIKVGNEIVEQYDEVLILTIKIENERVFIT